MPLTFNHRPGRVDLESKKGSKSDRQVKAAGWSNKLPKKCQTYDSVQKGDGYRGFRLVGRTQVILCIQVNGDAYKPNLWSKDVGPVL